jgi:hypothetical protein
MMHNFYIGRGKKLGHCLKIKPYPFKLWSNHSLKNIVFLTSTISSNGLRISFFFHLLIWSTQNLWPFRLYRSSNNYLAVISMKSGLKRFCVLIVILGIEFISLPTHNLPAGISLRTKYYYN